MPDTTPVSAVLSGAKLSEPQRRALKALVQDGNLYLHSTGNRTVLVGPAETKVCGVGSGYSLIKRGFAVSTGRFGITATQKGRDYWHALRAAARQASAEGVE